MTNGMRQRVREDLEIVYYYRGDVAQDDDEDPGWYIEDASNKRIGPFDSAALAAQYARTMPASIVFPSE
jgi:hypothetical protein